MMRKKNNKFPSQPQSIDQSNSSYKQQSIDQGDDDIATAARDRSHCRAGWDSRILNPDIRPCC